MDNRTEQLLDAAIQLPPTERVALTEALLASIPAGSAAEMTLDPETGKAWGEAVERRIADAAAGRAKMIPAADAKPGRCDA